MRTLIYTAFVSLDGVVDSPGGGGAETHRSGGWTFKDLEFLAGAYEIKAREQAEATAMMMGRVSYEAFSPVWPEMEEFADYKVMPKYVVSTTLSEDDLVSNWSETTILRSLDEVAELKETEGVPTIANRPPTRRPVGGPAESGDTRERLTSRKESHDDATEFLRRAYKGRSQLVHDGTWPFADEPLRRFRRDLWAVTGDLLRSRLRENGIESSAAWRDGDHQNS